MTCTLSGHSRGTKSGQAAVTSPQNTGLSRKIRTNGHLYCEIVDMRLVYQAMCLFTPHLSLPLIVVLL